MEEVLRKKWLEIAERIQAILVAKNLSQADLARLMDVPRSYVTRLLRSEGENPPTLKTLVAIEVALGEPILEASRSPIGEQA